MPSVAPRTGGVPTAVLDGRTGVLLDASAPASEYADAVQRMVEEPSWYATLCHASRDRYERELNWESACRSVLDLLPV
jgi:glycosyltransferase involved in cell wall biosynthesis